MKEAWIFAQHGRALVITLRAHPDPTVDPEDITVDSTDNSEWDEVSTSGARSLILNRMIPAYQAQGWRLLEHQPMQ
ncbi:hypothetical protein AMK17_08005 [Streptomyces sp. CB00072]|uniref:hypothetical protein n=1 Tax=Streptomyces sp. CB00072 TaxID=1703928 RepID=UPI00093CF552|nr:hypothetical protein [Streptomyces sp. CB00072]OKI59808.1 hypothetical protein AMK17_08005 [Streptomyces sp. CB00072]